MQFIYNAKNFEGYAQSSVTDGYVDFSGHLHNGGGRNLTVEEYINLPGHEGMKVASSEEMLAMIGDYQRKKYLTPARSISEKQWFEALEVLPPENWQHGAIEHFRMMEYTTGNITTQYARMNDRHIMKNIDVTDKETWITAEDFDLAESDIEREVA